jgi:signal-transduction protein with cAMP-binding, CBS, and nucleotidyltransferase domain
MPLTFSIVENFVADYREIMKDRGLLRQERHRILSALRDQLQSSIKDYEAFEFELDSLVIHRVENAANYEELNECHARAVVGIENFFLEEDTVTDVHDLFRIVRDAITVRVLKLVEDELKRDGLGEPPAEYIWIGLGSEGRDEQTMLTDQDNMIIYGETNGSGVTTEQIDSYFLEFSNRAVERLHGVGFEKCKGGVMPSNEKWRGSLKTWKKRIEDRITYDKGIFESLDVIILTDARHVYGKKRLLDNLLSYFFEFLRENRHVMKDFIDTAVLMPTALSFFGNFKVEKEGEYKDTFNIKLTGWTPLILSVRMLAINNGIFEVNTLQRIKLLRETNIIKKEMENDLISAYLTFVRFRIMNQINSRADGKDAPGFANHINPETLRPDEQEKIRKGMKSVEALQKYIKEVLTFGQ